MRMQAILAAALVVTLVLAGCTDPATQPAPTTSSPQPQDPIPTGDEHAHDDPEQHRIAWNMSVVDHDDLQRFGASEEEVVGAHAMASHGALLAVAVAGPQQQGFHLYDVGNGSLEHLAFYDAGIRIGGDRTIAFGQDGRTVFLGHEGGPEPGVQAVDVSDPRSPQRAGFFADAVEFGPHTLGTGSYGGTQYVFLLSLGVTILEYADGTFTPIGRYATADDLAILEAADSSSGPDTYAFRALYGHDMAFWVDPVSDTPYLAVAYAYDGVKVLDLSVPQVPLMTARWTPPTETGHRHYVHSAGMYRDADDRAILVVGSETFEAENQGIASPVWILDVTSALESPIVLEATHLSTWTNPSGAPAGSLQRSVHFFRILDGTLYLSHYHGGVWVLDIARPTDTPPATLGYILPVADAPAAFPENCCIGFDLGAVPMVFDVEVAAGHVFAADLIQGVFMLRSGP